MTPLAEQATSRVIEVCFESLPQAFIQTVFILRAPSEATTLQLASLVSSLVAVGFVVANSEYVVVVALCVFSHKNMQAGDILTADTSRSLVCRPAAMIWTSQRTTAK